MKTTDCIFVNSQFNKKILVAVSSLISFFAIKKSIILKIGADAAVISAACSLYRYSNATVYGKKSPVSSITTTENVEILPNIFCDINDGVQGESSSDQNSILLHREVSYDPNLENMHVSFG